MAFLIVGLLIHLFLLANLRFEAWPEMLVYPYLLNHGFKLYQDIINPYPPLFTYFLASWFQIFTLNVFNLKLLTWAIILVTDFLIYQIARRFYGQRSAIMALIFFIIFQPLLDGNGLWYDLALTPVLLVAFYRRSPALLAVSFFIKQSVIWLFPLFLKLWKRLLVSVFILFAIGYVLFASNQALPDYLFWPWRFALTILPTMPGHKDFGSPLLWLIAVIPFVPLIFLKKTRPFSWVLLSSLFIFPRFGLFHLQPALAFAALSLAASLQSIKLRKLHVYAFMLVVALLWYRQINLFWRRPDRFFEPEILQAAETLKNLTSPQSPLLFLNAPDQLMILADRLPTKPWAITFPWYLELPGMQQRFIDVATNHPIAGVVFSPYQNQGQFAPGSYRPAELDNFVKTNFTQQGKLTDNIYLLTRP